MPTPILDRYVALLQAWDRARKAADAIDQAKYPESRYLADWEVTQVQAEIWELKDGCAADLAAVLKWLRDSGRHDDTFASLIKDAVHDLVEQRVEQYRSQTASLAQRVEQMEAKIEELLYRGQGDGTFDAFPTQG